MNNTHDSKRAELRYTELEENADTVSQISRTTLEMLNRCNILISTADSMTLDAEEKDKAKILLQIWTLQGQLSVMIAEQMGRQRRQFTH
jgi:hypothetical protein